MLQAAALWNHGHNSSNPVAIIINSLNEMEWLFYKSGFMKPNKYHE